MSTTVAGRAAQQEPRGSIRGEPVHARHRPAPELAAEHEVGGATPRRYLMCRPTYFDVTYTINPWMDPSRSVDRERAIRQWDELRRAYLELGHRIDLVEPSPGLPDMVFAANAGLVLDGKVLVARFRHPERAPELAAYSACLRELVTGPHGLGRIRQAASINEGEGDFLPVGEIVLAGTGFRTEPAAHREAQEYFARPVVSLQLTDPRYYHLDTALAVLDRHTVAYLPDAFAAGTRQVLRWLFPDAIEVAAADAAVLGLNAVSDGYHVVLPAQATGLAAALRERGFEPVPVDLSELRKAGGGPKCAMLEIR